MSSSICASFIPHSLRCEYLENPLGVETPAPRLSWQLPVDKRGARQTAYQVLVAGSPALLRAGAADLWDSGKVENEQSIHVAYSGTELASGQRCYWCVSTWDRQGNAGVFSAVAFWEMGLLHQSDWVAQWIAPDELRHEDLSSSPPPSPLFRKELTLSKPLRSARLHICGLGYYELSINGRRVGDHVLDPLFTRYDVRALYVTHDVTAHLQPGANTLGVMLGNGWYNCFTDEVWNFHAAPWRDYPKLFFQLHLTFTDGTSETVVSDSSWKAAGGPVVFDGLRNGETYDARRELPGWDQPGFADAAWRKVMIVPAPGGVLTSQRLPIKVTETITPRAVTEVKPGVFIIDLGQNIAGWAQLSVTGAAGTEITLRYAEKLVEDGDIDQSNINGFIKSGDCQTDRYICKGAGVEVWEPRFTYHGFRWIQVTGFPGTPTIENFRGRVAHSAFSSAGDFACSNETLNAIQRCARWSFRGNFVGIPTDCPHREKNGWTGDALLAAETGLFNFSAAPAYLKWLDDLADALRPSGQLPGIVPTGGWGYNWGSGPAWDSAYTHIPWYLYLYCGDARVLETHYPGMRRYLDYMTSMAADHICSFGLGDWCPPDADAGGHKTPAALTSTGYYYANCQLLAHIADLLGHPEDAERYKALAAAVKDAFNRAFYDPATGRYSGNVTTSMACALFQEICDPAEEQKVLDALLAVAEKNDYRADFGILGAKYVLNTLADHGRNDAAYAIASQTEYPGWGWWLAHGATTLWESWEGGSSRNHIMFGDISAWMFKELAGIHPDPARPGFQHTIIRPRPVPGLTWVRAEHRSLYGAIRSAWTVADGLFTLEVSLPANTNATVYLPAASGAVVTDSGLPVDEAEGVSVKGREGDYLVLEVGAGEYRFAMVV